MAIRIANRGAMSLSPITDLIADLKAGRMAVLVDEEDRENEGDLIFAADFVTPEKINFMATHCRGLICMAITATHADRLNLVPMVAQNRSVHGTNFTVSIEAAQGVADRHLGQGPRAHDPRRRRDRRQAVRHRAARARVSADRAAGRRARPRRSHRGVLRPGRARGAHARGRALRDHERRRHDGAAARSRSSSRAPTA